VRFDPRSVPVRFSALKRFALSPLHYLSSIREPDDSDNLSRRIGRGAHALMFRMPCVAYPGKVRNGKQWDEFKAEHDGKAEILNRREMDQAQRMVDALNDNALTRSLLLEGTTCEQRIDWRFLGRACRSTPDAYKPDVVTDLKSTRVMPPHRFISAATKMAYHGQLAFYSEALRSTGLANPSAAFIVAVESVPPYSVTVLELTARALDMGKRTYRLWFEQLLSCEASDSWPGYAEGAIPFDVADDDDFDMDDPAGPDDPDWADGAGLDAA